MIEFKGDYYHKGRQSPQAVLVQFDGVLLHVWHLSDPFHRLLTSDVFRLPSSFGKRRRYIKLPNGGRIETDDTGALGTLQSNALSGLNCPVVQCPVFRFIAVGGALILLASALLIVRRFLGA